MEMQEGYQPTAPQWPRLVIVYFLHPGLCLSFNPQETLFEFQPTGNFSESDIKFYEGELHSYLLILALASAILFFLTLAYFPSSPPLPPSKSSSAPRTPVLSGKLALLWSSLVSFRIISCSFRCDFIQKSSGLRQLASSPQAWALVMAASVCQVADYPDFFFVC